MKVMRLEAHNVMGIRDVDMDMEGHHLFLIGGRNGSGKTSAITALLAAICGKRGMDFPEHPVRDGESEAWVRVETDGDAEIFQDKLRIERTWNKKPMGKGFRESLRIVSGEGFEAPEPQTLLNSLFVHRGFDPLAFLRMKRQDQVEQLRKIVGLDFDELNENRQHVYSRRTEVNRQVKELEARLADLPDFAEVPDAPVEVSEIDGKIADARRINRDADQLSKDAELAEGRAESLVSATEAAEEHCDQIEKEIARLQSLLEAQKQKIAECSKRHDEAVQHAKTLRQKAESAERVDIDDLEAERREAEETNRKVAKKRRVDTLKKDLRGAKARSKSLTSQLNEIDQTKQEMIDSAPWPVEGLRFTEDGQLLLKDIPLNQCSAAEQIATSVRMGMAANPKLKLLVIQHGECMDDETLKTVEEVAVSEDYQLLVEFMTRDADDEARCQVVIEEGRLKASPA